MKPLRITLLALAGLALLAPAASASFAGDNGRIYFSTSRAGAKESCPTVFSMTPRGTDIEPVADLPGAQREPAVSPAADLLAFWSYGGGNSDLWTVGTDGLDARPARRFEYQHAAGVHRRRGDGRVPRSRRRPGDAADEHDLTVPAGGGSSSPVAGRARRAVPLAGVLGGRRADGVHAGGP